MKAGRGENGEGRGGCGPVLTLYQRLSEDIQSYLSVPWPITSPGRSAGVGGERSGLKRSLLPPRHSSTTLPKLETVWAWAPAGLRWGCSLTLVLTVLLHVPPALFGLETLGLGVWWSGERPLWILLRTIYSATSYITKWQRRVTCNWDVGQWKWCIFLWALIVLLQMPPRSLPMAVVS